MNNIKKLFVLLLTVLLSVFFSSCSIVKSFLPKAEEEIPKPFGYIETKQTDIFAYDVFRNHISISGYIGKEKEVVIPDTIDGKTVTTIASLAFYENNIPEKITLPETITKIEEKAFYCCMKLKEINIPATVSEIGERAFAWCSDLKNIKLPEGIETIPDYAFNNCASLTKIELPSTVKSIGMRAFSYCTSLKRIELPSSVKKIGENAFLDSTKLEYVIISENTSEFGAGVLKNCANVTVVAKEGSPAAKYCADNQIKTTAERPADESIPDDSSTASGKGKKDNSTNTNSK